MNTVSPQLALFDFESGLYPITDPTNGDSFFSTASNQAFLDHFRLSFLERVRLSGGEIQGFTTNFPRYFNMKPFCKPEMLKEGEELFSIDIYEFGKGNIEEASDEWLNLVAQSRKDNQNPFKPSFYRLYFIIQDGTVRAASLLSKKSPCLNKLGL